MTPSPTPNLDLKSVPVAPHMLQMPIRPLPRQSRLAPSAQLVSQKAFAALPAALALSPPPAWLPADLPFGPSPRLPAPAFPSAYRRATSATDRKSTRLNSSHQIISYAVFCLKKKYLLFFLIHFQDNPLHLQSK